MRYDQETALLRLRAACDRVRPQSKGAGKRSLLTQPKQSFHTEPVLRANLQPLVVEAVYVTARKLSGAPRRSLSFDAIISQRSTPHRICVQVTCRHARFCTSHTHITGLQVLHNSSLHTNLFVSVARRQQSCGSDKDNLKHQSFFWYCQLDLRWLWISGLLPLTQQHTSRLDLSLIILL